MNAKPISPAVHGIIDYGFSAALFTLPHILKLNKHVKWLYTVNALNTFLYSAATDYPPGIKHVIPYQVHRKIDVGNITALALAILYKPVCENKRVLCFHISVIAAAILTVSLTDWNAES